MTNARVALLTQIFAALGAGAVGVAACGGSVVAPDTPANAAAECPQAKGPYAAQWPDGKEPEFMSQRGAVCLPKPANGDCATYTNRCVLSRYVCGVHTGGDEVLDKLPSKEPDECCWKVAGMCAVGRPFVVAGEARLAPLAHGDAWKMHAIDGGADDSRSLHALDARTLDARALDARTRAALADVWARDGLTEHASVASFAQLVLELLALGAPADLVLGAQQAMADEVRHAQRAFSLASRYAGRDLAPGRLDTRGAGANAPDLAAFAARTASEGCIAETIAALQLHAAADAATHPALAALLRATANEESVHALLAYRIVAWAIAEEARDDAAPPRAEGGRVRAAVAAVFANAASHVGFGPLPSESADALDLRAHGILSRRERHDLAVIALREVIAPAGQALTRATGGELPVRRASA